MSHNVWGGDPDCTVAWPYTRCKPGILTVRETGAHKFSNTRYEWEKRMNKFSVPLLCSQYHMYLYLKREMGAHKFSVLSLCSQYNVLQHIKQIHDISMHSPIIVWLTLHLFFKWCACFAFLILSSIFATLWFWCLKMRVNKLPKVFLKLKQDK